MSQLFRNRWLALLWLATTLFSASLFVGDDGGAEKLHDTAEQIRAQRQQLQAVPTPSSRMIQAEQDGTATPLLLPADDLDADPHNPKPGDVFIDAVSGRRVRIVARETSAEPLGAGAE